MVRALPCHGRGRGFESRSPRLAQHTYFCPERRKMANRFQRKTEAKSSKDYPANVFSQLRLGESYTSLFLGIVVVVVVLALLFSFLRTRPEQSITTTDSTNIEETEKAATPGGAYVVREGETLWSIAQSAFGSGYNWTDIAEANKLPNPDQLEVGTRLTIPKVDKKVITQEVAPVQDSITEREYVVVEGDNLWDIAVRSYGDGFRWAEIARINKITTPDLIYAGNKIILNR